MLTKIITLHVSLQISSQDTKSGQEKELQLMSKKQGSHQANQSCRKLPLLSSKHTSLLRSSLLLQSKCTNMSLSYSQHRMTQAKRLPSEREKEHRDRQGGGVWHAIFLLCCQGWGHNDAKTRLNPVALRWHASHQNRYTVTCCLVLQRRILHSCTMPTPQ